MFEMWGRKAYFSIFWESLRLVGLLVLFLSVGILLICFFSLIVLCFLNFNFSFCLSFCFIIPKNILTQVKCYI